VVVLNTSAGPRRAHASYTSHHIVNSTVFIHTHISVDITSKYYFKTNDMTKSIACEVPAAYLSALNAVFLFAILKRQNKKYLGKCTKPKTYKQNNIKQMNRNKQTTVADNVRSVSTVTVCWWQLFH